MQRAVLVVLGMLAATTTAAQEAAAPPKGWTRALSTDQKHYVWNNRDLEGRGCDLAFYTDGWAVKIHTTISLLDMADVDDGKLTVALLSRTRDRLAVDGILARDQQSVNIEESLAVRDWLLEKENDGQEITVILAGNGKRETCHFLNVNTTTEEKALKLDDPPKPKKAPRK